MVSARFSPLLRATSFLLACGGLVHCGGVASAPEHGPTAPASEAGTPSQPAEDSGVPAAEAGPCGRPVVVPTVVACAPTSTGVVGGVAISCATDTDCNDAGPHQSSCFHGHCAADGCSTDADCPGGLACECAIQFQGDGIFANRCVTPLCYKNSDCGPGGVCSPVTATTTACGGIGGSYCRRPADTCTTNADCCGDTPVCTYNPTLAHWACVAVQICSG